MPGLYKIKLYQHGLTTNVHRLQGIATVICKGCLRQYFTCSRRSTPDAVLCNKQRHIPAVLQLTYSGSAADKILEIQNLKKGRIAL
jgi:hypothetical protein